jgi:hypothetical protein
MQSTVSSYFCVKKKSLTFSVGLAFHIKSKGGLPLPSGGILTVRGLLTLGRHFGFHGGLDSIHDIVLRMRTDLTQFQFITRPTLSAVEKFLSFDDIVLYAILHEPCYCQGVASVCIFPRLISLL